MRWQWLSGPCRLAAPWKDDRDVSPHIFHLRTKEEMRPALEASWTLWSTSWTSSSSTSRWRENKSSGSIAWTIRSAITATRSSTYSHSNEYFLLENPQTQPLASQDTDGEVEPQSLRSDRSILLQSKENPQNQKGQKTKKEDLPVAKKHKSMDSDEDHEEPQMN